MIYTEAAGGGGFRKRLLGRQPRVSSEKQQRRPARPTFLPGSRLHRLGALALFLAALLLLLESARSQFTTNIADTAVRPAVTAAAGSGSGHGRGGGGGGGATGDVHINELMAANQGVILDQRGHSPDWVELYNSGQSEVQLEGWMLRTPRHNWTFPAGSRIPAAGYLLLYASGVSQLADVASAAAVGAAPFVRAALKLNADNPTLTLLRPDGSEASSVGPDMPRQPANISFGVPGAAELGAATTTVSRDSSAAAPLTFLARPTPGTVNSGPLQAGPYIYSASRPAWQQPRAPPGADIPINITLEPNLNPIDEQRVVLSYVVNWGPEHDVQAVKIASGPGRKVVFSASIPRTAFGPGDMVRWRAKASDTSGYRSIYPGSPEPQAAATDDHGSSSTGPYPRYFGTAVEIPEADLITDQVPVLEWFSPDPAAAITREGADGQVLFFNGRLYDNVASRRRGVTALSWPKPKVKFTMPQDEDFEYQDDMPPVGEFGLQSFWFELGERSYMKEPLALQFMRDAGVIAPNSFYVHVRQNGKFYGLFAFVEIPDAEYLKRYGLPPSGPLYKSVSGELSNLRWDLPVKEMPSFWEKENRMHDTSDWNLLANFSKGLAGGDAVPRSKYIYDHVNLPQVINDMAAQAIVNNMDRCTKNFFTYLNPDTDEWYMLPWDMDGSFGQDNGLGGRPGPNYCVLACEQWNSPLYCDSEHPQDLQRSTPWGQVSATFSGAYEGPALTRKALNGQRKLQQQQQQQELQSQPPQPSGAPTTRTRRRSGGVGGQQGAPPGEGFPEKAAGNNITSFPAPRGWDNPDRSTITETSPNGPVGTYNHLYDAILDVNSTRAMYMRRLRTLADKYLAGGQLAQFANETYTKIKPLADLDAKTWNSGISIDRGYQQITREFLPIRKEQLLGSLYGPQGRRPLLPEAQPVQVALKIARFVPGRGGNDADGEVAFVEVANANPFAVDVSNWRLEGPANFKFPPGAVIAPSASVYVVTDPVTFRSRTQPPTGGQGLLVLSPLQLAATTSPHQRQQQPPSQEGAPLKLLDAAGSGVHELPTMAVRK
ncbi:hypothetical protein Vafri_1405 [Volvox africanus]|nr:hypothetical protein Vafri_1405 [Volvox africanus]